MFGSIISLLTFPGVVAHEWAHKKFCDWFGVPVRKVVYFRLGDPAGYVVHDEPVYYKQILGISIGPLIINTALAVLLGFIAARTALDARTYGILVWLAFSIGMHAFPSDHDVKHVSTASKAALKRGLILHALAFPLVWLIRIANALRVFWFDGVYAAALVGLGVWLG